MTQPNPPIHDNLPAVLVQGYRGFRVGRLRDEQTLYQRLSTEGQKPPVLLIGCCDSRVAPESIFDAGPGELFVMRNIAALVPPFDAEDALPETPSAIEYAVMALKVSHIVVMGHAQCGGIRAFAQGEVNEFEPLSEANFVAKWKRLVKPAAERLGEPSDDFDAYCESLCRASIIQGLRNLRTYPWLKAREDAGDLTLHGACFGIAKGELEVLDQVEGTFVSLGGSA